MSRVARENPLWVRLVTLWRGPLLFPSDGWDANEPLEDKGHNRREEQGDEEGRYRYEKGIWSMSPNSFSDRNFDLSANGNDFQWFTVSIQMNRVVCHLTMSNRLGYCCHFFLLFWLLFCISILVNFRFHWGGKKCLKCLFWPFGESEIQMKMYAV